MQHFPLLSSSALARCWNRGFDFHYLTAIHYSARHESLVINWTLGTLVIKGPKVLEFYDDFCNHRATSLKSDGKDILAVTMILNAERDAN